MRHGFYTPSTLLRSPDLLSTLPVGTSYAPPIFFTKALPLHVAFCNYASFARNTTLAELMAIINAPSCACAAAPADCRHPSTQHVMTTSPYELLPGGREGHIAFHWDSDARFRFHPPAPPQNTVLAAMAPHVDRHAYHQSKNFPPGAFDAWPPKFLELMERYFTDHDPPTHFHWHLLSPTDICAFKVAVRGYIVTVTDKSSATFQLVCVQFYARQCYLDLTTHPLYYSPVVRAHRDAVYQAHNLRLQHLGLRYDAACRDAYYAGTIKMHKDPPSTRFLACSQNCPSTEISHCLTAVLRAVTKSFSKVWAAELPDFPMWLIDNSSGVISMLHAFNAAQFPVNPAAAHAAAPSPAVARDFSRLYTNLPHDKIRAALHALFAKCLAAEGTTHLLVTSWLPKPTTDTPVPQVHYKAQFARRTDYTPSVGSRYREHQSGDITRKITLDDFDALLDTLLDATFIEFAGLLVQQICGTPMGISPAPFIANLFLAWYEFEFLQQYNTFAPVDIPDDSTADERTAQEAQNDRNRAVRRLLREFIWTRRYLDDLLSLRNPHLEPLLKRGVGPAPGHVIHGLYPEELDIPVQQHPHLPDSDVPFLDVLICFVPVDGVCRFTTRLYDKRYQPAFLHVRLSRFIHSSSNVNEAAKRTIFISQFRRLQRIILDIDNFIFEIADLIVTLMERGYLRPQLLRQCADQLFFLPQLFLVQRRTPAYRNIMDLIRGAVQDLLPRKRRHSS
ncbi:hypothetical protein TSOC_003439 [Tetrabaena socialis]|uniref:Helix-turn-helix domain-containing protein n=1 Tax=Tetrabaena socialis TaxID=47790 RepID=A0A2J8ABR3_9CHLO|nr:hypothetical protein TSOC_003439 [Tetrabaena socialis]|eukprot:PNH09913.1 hypothetical protein TSOC_003439 [Tetrabaena socialis]